MVILFRVVPIPFLSGQSVQVLQDFTELDGSGGFTTNSPQTSDQESQANSGLLTYPAAARVQKLQGLFVDCPPFRMQRRGPSHPATWGPQRREPGIAHLPGEPRRNRCAEFLTKRPGGSTNASTVSGVTSFMISFPSTCKRNSAELKETLNPKP